jgi:hypothetical protein
MTAPIELDSRALLEEPALNSPALDSSAICSDVGSATLERDDIVLRDRHGRRILSYGPAGITLLAEDGDLVLAAPRGKVRIDAASGFEVSTPARASITAREFVTRCSDAIHHAGRFELRAERMFERARDSYREVEGLVQLRAGRLRQLIDGASQLLSKRASITCEEDVSIDGQRVLLG